MGQNRTLSPKQEKAALALAKGLTQQASADEAGVARSTLHRYLDSPEFHEAITRYRGELDHRTMQRWIAQKHRRVDVLMSQADRIRDLMDARADDLDEVAGGETGLLVRQHKSIGFGENNTLVTEYAFDAALNRELRETLKQAAQELGQWTEKQEVDGNVKIEWVRVHDDATD